MAGSESGEFLLNKYSFEWQECFASCGRRSPTLMDRRTGEPAEMQISRRADERAEKVGIQVDRSTHRQTYGRVVHVLFHDPSLFFPSISKQFLPFLTVRKVT